MGCQKNSHHQNELTVSYKPPTTEILTVDITKAPHILIISLTPAHQLSERQVDIQHLITLSLISPLRAAISITRFISLAFWDVKTVTSLHLQPCCGRRTVAVKLMPPLSFFLNPMLGGCLLSRMPKPSSSCSISFLWTRGFNTSSTIRIRLQVRATEIEKSKRTTEWRKKRVHHFYGGHIR